MKERWRWFFLAGLWLSISLCAHDINGQGAAKEARRQDHKDQVDSLYRAMVGQCINGAVVGLITPSGEEVYGYGEETHGGKVPNGDTFFEVGSLTKCFTGLVLAEMVKKGEVALQEPVQSFLSSQGVTLPVKGEPITLKDLATHTSGFPMVPTNFRSPTSYTLDQFYAYLNHCRLFAPPGEYWRYSNAGMGLLGYTLSGMQGITYEAMVQDRILAPLGMADTAVVLSAEQLPRIAQPHSRLHRPVAALNWKTDALVGAGGLRSTVSDMLIFLKAEMGMTQTPLSDAIAMTHQPHYAVNAALVMGLGWFMEPDGSLYYHEGETDGCTAYVAFSPSKKVGVVVLSNSLSARIHRFGRALQDGLMGTAWVR